MRITWTSSPDRGWRALTMRSNNTVAGGIFSRVPEARALVNDHEGDVARLRSPQAAPGRTEPAAMPMSPMMDTGCAPARSTTQARRSARRRADRTNTRLEKSTSPPRQRRCSTGADLRG
jgi:hypothetical protein